MRDVRERAQGGIGKRWRRVRGGNSGTVVGDEAGSSEDGATGDVGRCAAACHDGIASQTMGETGDGSGRLDVVECLELRRGQ
jgi:hypothetical protein